MTDPDDDRFDGEAHVATIDDEWHPVRAVLAARFDPVLGRLVWYGRVQGDGVPLSPGGAVHIRTPHGRAAARVTEQDLWGHWHLRGESAPPFPVELLGQSSTA